MLHSVKKTTSLQPQSAIEVTPKDSDKLVELCKTVVIKYEIKCDTSYFDYCKVCNFEMYLLAIVEMVKTELTETEILSHCLD